MHIIRHSLESVARGTWGPVERRWSSVEGRWSSWPSRPSRPSWPCTHGVCESCDTSPLPLDAMYVNALTRAANKLIPTHPLMLQCAAQLWWSEVSISRDSVCVCQYLKRECVCVSISRASPRAAQSVGHQRHTVLRALTHDATVYSLNANRHEGIHTSA